MRKILSKNITIGIIGTGAVGSALAVLLSSAGYTIASVSGRNVERTHSLAQQVSAKNNGHNNEATVRDTDVIFLCLNDDALGDEIERLAAGDIPFRNKIFYHTAGAVAGDIFDPLRKKGASAGSFHPLQSIPRDGIETTLHEFAVAIEGDQLAVDVAVEMAREVGAHPIVLGKGSKVLYHAAASLASNGLVGLTGVVEEMIQSVGLEAEGRAYFYKLMEQSLDNSRKLTAEKAITGPASRGDMTTLKQHLSSLRESFPHLVPIYIVIGSHCVSLAVRSGKLSQKKAEQILDMFSNELQSVTMFTGTNTVR